MTEKVIKESPKRENDDLKTEYDSEAEYTKPEISEEYETPHGTSYYIKIEPEDRHSPDSSCNEDEGNDTGNEYESLETTSRQFETVTVKVEPVNPDSVDEGNIKESPSPRESPQATPVFLIKRSYNRKSKVDKVKSDDEQDEDYLPPSKAKREKKKEKGELQYKPTYRLKKNTGDQTYSADITNKVQIVQITEEQRRQEHTESLNSRRHFKYVCAPCAIGFVLEEAYLMHMMVHSSGYGAHECDVCRSRHKTAENLYSHRLRHYRRYRCSECGSLFKDRDAAACHVMTTHARQAFVCEHCGKGFKRPQYLKGHMDQYHTKQKSYECPECQRVFHERGRWRCHVRSHNAEVRPEVGVFACSVCDKQLRSRAYLTRHMTTTHGGSNRCSLCGETCKSKEKLSSHLRRAHGATDCMDSYACPHCRRVLTTRGMLKRHVQRMHLDRTKKFECDYCKRLYYTKAEVRSHIMWSHLRARGGHACACGRVFRTPARLRDHQARVHAGLPTPRNHPCEQCGKAFGNKQLLTRHMKVHGNEKFPCTECEMTFKTEGYVKIHYKLKHLNMTRAEIKAQTQRPKPLTIEKGMLLKNAGAKNPVFGSSVSVKVEKESVSVKVKKESVGDKGSEDIQIPLFETFIDIQRN